MLGLAALRFGTGLALVRGALAGDGPGALALALGAPLPGLAGPALVLVAALALGAVLARSTSRAAEVSARFALDALPGAQAALEAELRSRGPLTASRERNALLEQARAKGAADGASRLLVADAIVGPLFGLAAAFGGGFASGVGVALLLLGAAFPAAFALSWSLREEAPPAASPWTRAVALAPLVLVAAGAPPLSMLLVAALLWVLTPPPARAASRFTLVVPAPLAKPSLLADMQRALPLLPALALESSPGETCELREGEIVLARDPAPLAVLRRSVAHWAGTAEVERYLGELAAEYPEALRAVAAPVSQLATALHILIEEAAPFSARALAEGFAAAPSNATPQELVSRVRERLRPHLLARLGAAPVPVARLSGEAEETLLSPQPLPVWFGAVLRESADKLAETVSPRTCAALCAREARRPLALSLPAPWVVLSPDEVPAELEIEFLGELSAIEPD
jgi:hypothetical protein